MSSKPHLGRPKMNIEHHHSHRYAGGEGGGEGGDGGGKSGDGGEGGEGGDGGDGGGLCW